MRIVTAVFAGLLFGLGLVLSGMTDPAKVLGFLDVTGQWDPSLLLVLGGAVLTAWPAMQLARRRTQAWTGAPMQLPQRRDVDRRLLIGSLLFGIGWGIAGLCPGPALVLLSAGHAQAWIFGLAMLAGMLLYARLEARRAAHT